MWRSQCMWRAGGKEFWSSPVGGGPTWQHPEVVRRDERWRSYGSVPQNRGIFPCRWMQPPWSLPPDGSRTQFLEVSLGWCDFRPSLHRPAGAKQGLNFKRGSLLLLEDFFPQRTGSVFKDWARAILHQRVTPPGSRNPPLLQLAAFSPSPEWRQPKKPSRRINILLYFIWV